MRKKSVLFEKLISTIEEKKSDTINPLEYASRAEQAVQDNFPAITGYEDNLRKIIEEIPLPNNKKLFVRFPGLIRKNVGEEEKKLVDQNPQYKPYSYYQVNSFAPILQEAAFNVLSKLCEEYQVGIIDVVSDFEKLPAEDHVKCFTDILHLKDKGNYHGAQSIFKELLRKNLL